MSVTRANVEATKAFIRARLGNPYVYGGALSNNVKQGTDCSEVWQTVLEMVHGRWQQGRQSEGATTESYRYIPVGGVGPFGTIRVNNWRDIPANAAARIAFHHGPGGGANSHMWGELDGMRIESGGSKGLQTGDRAMAVESSYANAWAYLPGPIDGVAGPPTPLGIGSTGPEVVVLQQRLNTEGAGLEVDGEYGQKTADAVTAWDRRTGYARLTLAEGVRRGISPRGIQISFTVPFVETGWKIYANSNVSESMSIKHDAVGTDHDSVGLWQQRCPMWGPANVLMDPTLSAGLFYGRLAKLDYNGSRPPGDYAADVQRPAAEYRGRYQERMGHAVALYTRLTTVQPPPAPQPQGDDDLSAEDSRMIREMYTEWQAQKRGPSRSFAATDGNGVDSPLGFLYNIDGNVWTQQLTWAYLFGVDYAEAVVTQIADTGVIPETWAAKQVDAQGRKWLSEFGQQYCQGLVAFRAAMVKAFKGSGVVQVAPQAAEAAPQTVVYRDVPAPAAAPSGDVGDHIAATYRANSALLASEIDKPAADQLVNIIKTKTEGA